MEENVFHKSFPYIPTLLPDEILFSWIVRLHLLNGCSDSRKTLHDLFSSKSYTPSIDLPGRLNEFVRNSDGWGPFKIVDDAINRGTLYPFYSRFMDEKHDEALRSLIAFDAGGRLKITMGLLANRFGASSSLRSCPDCDKENLFRWGTRYWLRVHQLPGMCFCPFHHKLLNATTLQSNGSNRHSLSSFAIKSRQRQRADTSIYVENRKLTSLACDALLLNTTKLSDQGRVSSYLTQSDKLGYSDNGRINWNALVRDIGDEYNWFEGNPFKERLLCPSGDPMGWLRSIYKRPSRKVHPICHLILIGFLYQDLASFFLSCDLSSTISGDTQLGQKKEAYGDQQILLDLVNDASLSCREAASRAGVSVTTIVHRRRTLGMKILERRKSVSEEKILIIEKLFLSRKSVEWVIKCTGLSASTIYRLRSQLQIGDRLVERKKKAIRQRWEAECKSHAELGRKILRSRLPSVYAWLYRNDKDWLMANYPSKLSSSRMNGRNIDWSQRDRDLASELFVVATEKLASGYRQRISRTLLLRESGHESLITKNLAKLPMVRAALAEKVESDDAFTKRRRQEAIDELRRHGCHSPSESQIERIMGIRPRGRAARVADR